MHNDIEYSLGVVRNLRSKGSEKYIDIFFLYNSIINQYFRYIPGRP